MMEVASLTQTLFNTAQRVAGAGPVREPSPIARNQQGTTAFSAPQPAQETDATGAPRLGIGIDGFGNPIEPTSLSALIGEDETGLAPALNGDEVPAGLAAPPPPPPAGERTAQGQAVAAQEDEEEDQQAAGTNDEAAAAAEEEAAEEEEGSDGLTPEEEAVVRELQARDLEVRRHEQAHAAAGGQYAGAPTYDYQRGPDGRLYAVGGEVSIDTSVIAGNPEANIRKFQQVRRAALAPVEPSPQDQRVAAEAQRQISESRAELVELRAEERAAASDEAAIRGAERGAGPEEPREPGEIRVVDPEAVAQVIPGLDSAAAVADPQVIASLAGLASPAPIGDSASRSLQASQAFLRTGQLAAAAPRSGSYF